MRNPQHGTDARYRPAQAPIDANGAQAIREGFSAGPAPQSLRTAQQIMRGLLGRHRGAVDLLQRWELWGLSGSAAGVGAVLDCLHCKVLSIPAARACDVQGFRSGMDELFSGQAMPSKRSKHLANPHECLISQGKKLPRILLPYLLRRVDVDSCRPFALDIPLRAWRLM